MKWVYHITNYATSKYIDNLIKDYVKFLFVHYYKVRLQDIYIRECIYIRDVAEGVCTGLPYKLGDYIYFMTLNEWESLTRHDKFDNNSWKIVNPIPYLTWEGKQDTYLTCNIDLSALPFRTVSLSSTENTCMLNISSSFENPDCPSIKKVIFNDPATIVYWWNGTKTIVKCQDGEPYDPEKGLALCFMKMMLGNKGNYNNVMKKLIEKYGGDQ